MKKNKSKAKSKYAKDITQRRVEAYIIDWILSGILIGLPEVLVYGALVKNGEVFKDLYSFAGRGFSSSWAYLCCALSFIIFVIYFVYIPVYKYPGQTLGKKIRKICVVDRDSNTPANLAHMCLREIVGLLVVEGVANIMGSFIRQTATLVTGFYIETYLLPVAYALTMVSAMMVYLSKNSLAIHDYIANTKVTAKD